MKSPIEEIGYEFAKGMTMYAGNVILFFAIVVILFSLLRYLLKAGLDDTDRDAWNRSGLRVMTDFKTGVQYLSDGNGGLVRREEKSKPEETKP